MWVSVIAIESDNWKIAKFTDINFSILQDALKTFFIANIFVLHFYTNRRKILNISVFIQEIASLDIEVIRFSSKTCFSVYFSVKIYKYILWWNLGISWHQKCNMLVEHLENIWNELFSWRNGLGCLIIISHWIQPVLH